MAMFVLLFVLWMVLNGRITPEIVLLGILITALVSVFLYRWMGYSFTYDRILFRNFPMLVLYFLILLREIIKSAFHVASLVWSRTKKPDPVLVEFHSGLPDSFANVLLANSITLTPGTFTVLQEGDHFLIHCLRHDFAEGLDSSVFIDLLRRLHV